MNMKTSSGKSQPHASSGEQAGEQGAERYTHHTYTPAHYRAHASNEQASSQDALNIPGPHIIDRYKPSCWLDKKRNVPVFGVKVHVIGHGWANLATDGKPFFVPTEQEARAKITEMKTERRAKARGS